MISYISIDILTTKFVKKPISIIIIIWYKHTTNKEWWDYFWIDWHVYLGLVWCLYTLWKVIVFDICDYFYCFTWDYLVYS